MPARRRAADDDMPIGVVAADESDEEDEEEDAQYLDDDEGLAHARLSLRPRPVRTRDDDEEDAATDQVIPDRVVRLQLPAPWRHLRIWAWLDYPEEVAKLFGPKAADESEDEAGERIMEGMRAVITRHDGWRDRDGLLPQPGNRKFWARLSTPLARAVTSAFFSVMRRNPTQQASRKRKPRS